MPFNRLTCTETHMRYTLPRVRCVVDLDQLGVNALRKCNNVTRSHQVGGVLTWVSCGYVWRLLPFPRYVWRLDPVYLAC